MADDNKQTWAQLLVRRWLEHFCITLSHCSGTSTLPEAHSRSRGTRGVSRNIALPLKTRPRMGTLAFPSTVCWSKQFTNPTQWEIQSAPVKKNLKIIRKRVRLWERGKDSGQIPIYFTVILSNPRKAWYWLFQAWSTTSLLKYFPGKYLIDFPLILRSPLKRCQVGFFFFLYLEETQWLGGNIS